MTSVPGRADAPDRSAGDPLLVSLCEPVGSGADRRGPATISASSGRPSFGHDRALVRTHLYLLGSDVPD